MATPKRPQAKDAKGRLSSEALRISTETIRVAISNGNLQEASALLIGTPQGLEDASLITLFFQKLSKIGLTLDIDSKSKWLKELKQSLEKLIFAISEMRPRIYDVYVALTVGLETCCLTFTANLIASTFPQVLSQFVLAFDEEFIQSAKSQFAGGATTFLRFLLRLLHTPSSSVIDESLLSAIMVTTSTLIRTEYLIQMERVTLLSKLPCFCTNTTRMGSLVRDLMYWLSRVQLAQTPGTRTQEYECIISVALLMDRNEESREMFTDLGILGRVMQDFSNAVDAYGYLGPAYLSQAGLQGECLGYITYYSIILSRIGARAFDAAFFEAFPRVGTSLVDATKFLFENRGLGDKEMKLKPYTAAALATATLVSKDEPTASEILTEGKFQALVLTMMELCPSEAEVLTYVVDTLVSVDALYTPSQLGPLLEKFNNKVMTTLVRPALQQYWENPTRLPQICIPFAASLAFHTPRLVPILTGQQYGYADLVRLAFVQRAPNSATVDSMASIANLSIFSQSRQDLAMKEKLVEHFEAVVREMNMIPFNDMFHKVFLQAVSNLSKNDIFKNMLACCPVSCAILRMFNWTLHSPEDNMATHLCSLALCATINLSSKCIQAKGEFHNHAFSDKIGEILQTFLNHRQICEFALWAVFNTSRDCAPVQAQMKKYNNARAVMTAFSRWKTDERVSSRGCKAIFALCKRNSENKKVFTRPNLNVVSIINSCVASDQLKKEALAALS